MEQPRYDEGQWPIVQITMPQAELKDAELMRHMDRISEFNRRGSPFALVIDVRASESLTADSRRVIAERLDQDEDTYPGVLLGVAIVLTTPLHRGIFKAISWLSRKPRPFEAFTSVDDAMAWARRVVAAPTHSMTMPVATDASKRVG
jgi:hypothetical protein